MVNQFGPQIDRRDVERGLLPVASLPAEDDEGLPGGRRGEGAITSIDL